MATKTTESKSPYEMRLQMLNMAKDYLDRQYETATAATMEAWKANLEFAKKVNNVVPEPVLPKMYTMDEITKLAEQFNAFVSGFYKNISPK